jgi:hypothetical protein
MNNKKINLPIADNRNRLAIEKIKNPFGDYVSILKNEGQTN